MSSNLDSLTQRGKWNVLTRIEKFDNSASLAEGIPDEVCEIPGNLLLNDGINALWAVFAGLTEIEKSVEVDGVMTTQKITIKPFDHDNSFIGVGNFANDPKSGSVAETDIGLKGPLKMYIGMDQYYPKAGADQKIIFKSTFAPGVACFKWYEWTIANGNANFAADSVRTDYAGRGNVTGFYNYNDVSIPDDGNGWEVVEVSLGDNPPPAENPTTNGLYAYGTGEDDPDIINLNHKQENMGEKYPPSTWIITVEISLV